MSCHLVVLPLKSVRRILEVPANVECTHNQSALSGSLRKRIPFDVMAWTREAICSTHFCVH